jgi:hypothetical protein
MDNLYRALTAKGEIYIIARNENLAMDKLKNYLKVRYFSEPYIQISSLDVIAENERFKTNSILVK